MWTVTGAAGENGVSVLNHVVKANRPVLVNVIAPLRPLGVSHVMYQQARNPGVVCVRSSLQTVNRLT